MKPILTMTIRADSALTTQAAVADYIEQLQIEHPELTPFGDALADIVNSEEDDPIEIYEKPDMDGGFVSSTNGIRLLWMPDIGRAAVNAYQAGDWQWTDAESPEDALRRYHNDDMAP